MIKIGLLGGMSWESTVTYYQQINETVNKILGGLHSAECLLYSVDFNILEECMRHGDWDTIAGILSNAAHSLEQAGAGFIVICTNTMHKLVPQIEKNIHIPILHIAQATADELKKNGISTAALLGTKYTMEQDFYKSVLKENEISVIIPNENDRVEINRIIFDELCLGMIREKSKEKYLSVISELYKAGAQGVVLGCTEIGLLIKQSDTDVALFDTTLIHARAAAFKALEKA